MADNIRYVSPLIDGVAATSQASAADGAVKLVLAQVHTRGIVKAINIVSGATAQDHFRVGIYGPATLRTTSEDPTCAGLPLIYGSDSISESGTNTTQKHVLTSQVVLDPGLYYLALETEGTTMTYMRQGNQRQVTGWGEGFTRSGGYGALPDPCPSTSETASALPKIVLTMVIDSE